MKHVQYRGRLTQIYKPNKPALSGFHTPPFHDDLDFESYRLLGRSVWPQSFVTYERKYELLAEIVSILREQAAGQFHEILFYSRMPSVMRMPKELFGPDLFFVVDLEAESQTLQRAGVAHFAVREGFLRHMLEDGDNSLTIDWHGAPENYQRTLNHLSQSFAGLGIISEAMEDAA